MANPIHSTAIKVDVFPDEFKPIMKAIKYSLVCDDSKALFNQEEKDLLELFLDNFCNVALNEAV